MGAICACPGCDQPLQVGPNQCGNCGLVKYCCRTCQVEDWPRHKEVDCQGHMRKVGMAHLLKAMGFDRDRNFVQLLRYSELALVKLKQLNDRPIEAIDEALTYKFNALNFMGQKRESLECAQERYAMRECVEELRQCTTARAASATATTSATTAAATSTATASTVG